jgi:hypothetical protein
VRPQSLTGAQPTSLATYTLSGSPYLGSVATTHHSLYIQQTDQRDSDHDLTSEYHHNRLRYLLVSDHTSSLLWMLSDLGPSAGGNATDFDPQNDCDLFRLPRELRDIIYNYVFGEGLVNGRIHLKYAHISAP